MRFMRGTKSLKSILCLVLAAVMMISMIPAASTTAAAAGGSVSCNVKYSMPAICCDAGQVIDLSACGVQFSADSGMVTSGITWTRDGSVISSFTPVEKGVYPLTAKHGNTKKTVYVVAKNPGEEEYVLYRNDFDSAPNDFRVIEKTNGSTISSKTGAYILNGSGHADGYVRVLLPEFLDDFGDARFEAGFCMSDAVDARKWMSLMYRVQSDNYPYYQGCLRFDATVGDGAELALRNASYAWEVNKNVPAVSWNVGGYNVCSVDVQGTRSVLTVNGHEVATYANTAFANGAFGIQVRGSAAVIDYVKVTIPGNAQALTSCDVSFSKPAIRADIGDTVDLTACDVQFSADSVYTKGSDIVWKKDGAKVTTITPSTSGVIHLTATSGGVTKNVYLVTRNLDDGEYVLYRNDFNTAPTDFRIVQNTGASFYHDGAGNYVIDASSSGAAYGRVLLPAFLDEFGDFKFETRYKDNQQIDSRCWSSLMGRVQNSNYPYMQMCVRYDTSVADGLELAQRNENDKWSVKNKASYAGKAAGNYNVYTLNMQGHQVWGLVNGDEAISYNNGMYHSGGIGLQAKGLKITVDYVKITLGTTSAQEDTAVKCTVSVTRPAIGCNAGQTVLLSECDVQFEYGFPAVDGSQITWKKDGKVITEFSDTSMGIHKLTATHGDTTMDVYVVAKSALADHYVLYDNDFSSAPLDFRVPEASNGGSCYQLNGNFVLNGSSQAGSYVRVLLPSWLDAFGDARLETSIKLTSPVDNNKWGAIMYRAQYGNYPYMQACMRYDTTASSGVEISQKNASNKWEVYQNTSSSVMTANAYNSVVVETHAKSTDFAINNSRVLHHDSTPYFNGGWGFHVRGLTMYIDYVRLVFSRNYTAADLYVVPGNYADVRDPATGINIAPALITEAKTKADFDQILNGSPAIAIFTYDVVDGEARVVFSDGIVSPQTVLDRLGGKIIPAFRINDTTDADSLAAFLIGNNLQDAFAVSTNPAVVKKAYENWKYIRGVVDYSGREQIDAEDIRYEATANGARVIILPENTSKKTVTFLQDSYSCVWLTVSEGDTASVTAINKGPYGIITPDRAATEECYRGFYEMNTLVRRTNVIGHRGNPSVAQENTISGAQTAYANGATAVENDFYMVADGVLMVMHDKTIDRATNGSGKTVSFTSAQLKQYVVDVKPGMAAQPIPSLEEYFSLVKGKADQRLIVEIKHPDTSFAKTFANLIKKYDILDQMNIIAFGAENIQAVRSYLPGASAGLLKRFVFNEAEPVHTVQSILDEIQTYNTVCNPGYTAMEPKMIRSFMYRGVTLWPWTINDQSTFDTLMVRGVGGITSDYSQWSRDMIEELTVTENGAVIATTYGGTKIDVTGAAEMVVIENISGLDTNMGRVSVPAGNDGYVSYFFCYKSTTPTGIIYHVVSEVIVEGSKEEIKVNADDLLDAKDAKIYNTTTPSAKFSPAAQPFTQNQRYLIMSDKYGYIMSYNPIRYAAAATTGSLVYDADGGSADSYYFSGSNVILDHSNRENVLWILRQYAQATGGTQIPDWSKLQVNGATSFGGQAFYPGIELQKGKYGESGVTYWSSVGGGNEYRYLCTRSDSSPFKNDADMAAMTGNADRPKYMVESYGDGTYLIYFKASATDFRILYCNADGVWGIRRYADGVSGCRPVSQVYNDMDELKIRLYDHIRDASTTKRVAFCGYQTFRVDSNATEAAVLDAIENNITVFDPDLKNLHVGCSGTDAKVGYYRLKFADKFNPNVDGTYRVQIIYRAEANSLGSNPNDVVIGTVNVVVHTHKYENVTVAPTCTEDGYSGVVCSDCGDVQINELIPTSGHTYIWGICSACDHVDETYVQPTYCLFGYINGANYACEEDHMNMGVYWFVDGKVSATFTQDSYVAVKTVGNEKWYMTDGWQGTEATSAVLYDTTLPIVADKLYVPAYTHVTFTVTENPDGSLLLSYEPTECNHAFEETDRKEATCTEDGYVSYHCSICLIDQVDTIPANGHKYIWDTCSNCGYVDENYVAPQYYLFGCINGANYACEEDYLNMGEYKFDGNRIHVTFLEDSYVAVKSQDNGNWYMTDGWMGDDATSATLYDTSLIPDSANKLRIPAKTHVILTITHNPDATLTLSYEIDANDHDYDAVITAPTCETDGYTTYTCICGSSYVGDQEASFGHSYETITVEPDCLTEGSVTSICDICGDSVIQTIPALGHSYKAVVTEPTCTEGGFTTNTCENCGHSYISDEVIAAGHAFEDGVCGNCGVKDPGFIGANVPCFLIGDMNGWDATTDAMGGELIRSVTVSLAPGTYQFKISYNEREYGNDGIIVDTTDLSSDAGWLMNTEAGNCTLVAAGGTYRFTFDPNTQLMRVILLTNETEDDNVNEGVITLKSMTLSLEDEIHYNLYFEISNINVSAEDLGIIIWDEEPRVPTIFGGGTVIEGATYVPSSGYYGVSSMGIPAKNMGDVKYFVAYAKQPGGGYLYSRVLQYSAKTYCMNRVANSQNEQMRALCVALMNYGAEAQKYFAITTDYTYTELMNVGFEQYQYLVESYDEGMVIRPEIVGAAKAGEFGTTANGFTKRNASVSADGSLALNYYFTTVQAADQVTFYYWNELQYQAFPVLTTANATGSKQMTPVTGQTQFWTCLNGIAAKEINKIIYACAVYEVDGVTYSTGIIPYSVGVYCGNKAVEGNQIKSLAEAMVVYGYHANVYFGD